MTYPDQLVRLIDERVAKGIAAFAKSAAQITGSSAGTVVYRTGATTAQITLDGSALAMPVKVFGDVELLAGDRVGLLRIGTDWTVIGTFTRRRKITMPDGATTGEQRMVWGADTPPELQAYGLTVAMMGFVLDSATGLEVGYFFQAVSNVMDSPPSRAMVFGNVTYPTPGNPATATVANVKTNFQMDLWSQFALTLFKDHLVDYWWPAGIKFDGVHAGRGLITRVDSTANTAAIGAEAVILTAASMTWRSGRAYSVEFHQLTLPSVANSFTQLRIRRTNLAGAIKSEDNFPLTVLTTAPETCQALNYIRNATGSDIVDNVVLTMGAGAGTNTGIGAAATVRWLEIRDVGWYADYANAAQI